MRKILSAAALAAPTPAAPTYADDIGAVRSFNSGVHSAPAVTTAAGGGSVRIHRQEDWAGAIAQLSAKQPERGATSPPRARSRYASLSRRSR